MSYKRLIVLLVTFGVVFSSSSYAQRPVDQRGNGGGGGSGSEQGGNQGGNGGGQGGGGGPETDNSSSAPLTQGELIEMLVKALGFSTMLPPNPSEQQMQTILMQNGIVPEGGWKPDSVVSLGTLARLVVQIMGESENVQNPEDDGSWVDYLASKGVDMTSIQRALQPVPPSLPNAGYTDASGAFDPTQRYPFSVPFAGEGFSGILYDILTVVLPGRVTPF